MILQNKFIHYLTGNVQHILKKYYHILVIITIACVIVFPRRSGYVMLLDFVTVPEYSWDFLDLYSGLVWIILEIIKILLGGMVMQYLVMM